MGERRDTGIANAEFPVSTMVDFAEAGVTGVAAPGLVAGGMLAATAFGGAAVAAAVASAPAWATLLVVGAVGAAFYAGLNHLVDIDQGKEDVANGLRAWDGIARNGASIAQVGAQRVGESIADTGESVAEAVTDLADNLFNGGS